MENTPFKSPATNTLLRRASTVAAVAALIFAWGTADAAHAQSPERFQFHCNAPMAAGASTGACNFNVPSNRRLVITSVTAYGSIPSSQSVLARLSIAADGEWTQFHYFQAGFQTLSGTWAVWNGFIPGTIYGDRPTIRFLVSRAGAGNAVAFYASVSGYYE